VCGGGGGGGKNQLCSTLDRFPTIILYSEGLWLLLIRWTFNSSY
jgi:hypothetical protein